MGRLTLTSLGSLTGTHSREWLLAFAARDISLAVQFAELIGWLIQAFPPISTRGISRCKAFICPIELKHSKLVFEYTHRYVDRGLEPYKSPEADSTPCWRPLFGDSVVVGGFQIPPRERQRGLEIGFENLMSLCGIEYPLEREGRIIFVGMSTILCPVEIYGDGSLQWHLIVGQSPDRLQSKLSNLSSPISVFTTEIVETFQKLSEGQQNVQPNFTQQSQRGWSAFMDRLRETRHFLGWCKEVEVLLGTRSGNYESVTWTKAAEIRTSRMPSSENWSLGTSGKGIFGASFARTYNIVHHRDSLYPFANREARFEEALRNHKEEQVILCDPEERRAWMVPFLNVLLHMIILRIKRHGHSASCDLLPFAEVGPDGAAEALTALMQSRATILHENEGRQGYHLEELTKMLLIALQNAYTAGMTRRTFMVSKLLGLELMDLVTCEPPFRLKRHRIAWSHGGWPHFARDVHLVLLCRGVGEALRPNTATLPQLCPAWRQLPKGADFLAASIRGLRHLALRIGFESGEYLMEGYRWFSPHNSFVYRCPRREHGASDCTCEPLQRLEKVSILERIFPKFIKPSSTDLDTGKLMALEDGAVVFGHSRTLRKAKQLAAEIGLTAMSALQHESAEPALPISSQDLQESITKAIQTTVASQVEPMRPQSGQPKPLETSRLLEPSSSASSLSLTGSEAENIGLLNEQAPAFADASPQSVGMSLLLSGKPLMKWSDVETDEANRKADAERQEQEESLKKALQKQAKKIEALGKIIMEHNQEQLVLETAAEEKAERESEMFASPIIAGNEGSSQQPTQ